MDSLRYESFSQFDHNDPFFDSLKSDYKEFPDWLKKKPTLMNPPTFSTMKITKLKDSCTLRKMMMPTT